MNFIYATGMVRAGTGESCSDRDWAVAWETAEAMARRYRHRLDPAVNRLLLTLMQRCIDQGRGENFVKVILHRNFFCSGNVLLGKWTCEVCGRVLADHDGADDCSVSLCRGEFRAPERPDEEGLILWRRLEGEEKDGLP